MKYYLSSPGLALRALIQAVQCFCIVLGLGDLHFLEYFKSFLHHLVLPPQWNCSGADRAPCPMDLAELGIIPKASARAVFLVSPPLALRFPTAASKTPVRSRQLLPNVLI